jgi:hypothetical protein
MTSFRREVLVAMAIIIPLLWASPLQSIFAEGCIWCALSQLGVRLITAIDLQL